MQLSMYDLEVIPQMCRNLTMGLVRQLNSQMGAHAIDLGTWTEVKGGALEVLARVNTCLVDLPGGRRIRSLGCLDVISRLCLPTLESKWVLRRRHYVCSIYLLTDFGLWRPQPQPRGEQNDYSECLWDKDEREWRSVISDLFLCSAGDELDNSDLKRSAPLDFMSNLPEASEAVDNGCW